MCCMSSVGDTATVDNTVEQPLSQNYNAGLAHRGLIPIFQHGIRAVIEDPKSVATSKFVDTIDSRNSNLPPNQLDPARPFYLHPTDNTANQLVSVKFKGEGYGDWRRSMMISMSSKNKLGFVNGRLPKPDPTDITYEAWLRCNDMMISWLLFYLDSVISKSVLYFNTAREIWLDLEDRFGFVSGPQLYALERQASDITQGSHNVAEFFTEIKSIWDNISAANPLPTCTYNLCTCNLTQKIFKMQQEQRLMQFLMKLGEHLAAARGNLLMQPLPTLSHAYRMLA
ncbi:uncharacterized protein [Spinacia oleracea]|uniref:Retrotransposon Copia-like N-terminal domain-containing protein n=1 Tax=Spinacia oleracea TaxID=3562 RepID=A0ABM3QX10_SPIOL|nr:uncharacterized protein LOC130462931 [Spinacia oleracea]